VSVAHVNTRKLADSSTKLDRTWMGRGTKKTSRICLDPAGWLGVEVMLSLIASSPDSVLLFWFLVVNTDFGGSVVNQTENK